MPLEYPKRIAKEIIGPRRSCGALWSARRSARLRATSSKPAHKSKALFLVGVEGILQVELTVPLDVYSVPVDDVSHSRVGEELVHDLAAAESARVLRRVRHRLL